MEVGKFSFDTTEKYFELPPLYKLTMLIKADTNCQISFTDNQHYQDYDGGDLIPLELSGDTTNGLKTKVYIKASGTGTLRYWIY
jgi:hypothetical protein